jgi:Na+-translocating ferredoxin:NAD+ oxidoreductase RnfG subunit
VSDILKSIIVVTLTCLGAGAIAVFSDSFFKPEAPAHETKALGMAARRLFAPGVSIREASGKKPLPAIYWIVKKDSAAAGYAFAGESRGPSGAIDFIAGMDTSGMLLGIEIIAEHRIPGQGVPLEDRCRQRSLWKRMLGQTDTARPWFTEQFTGTTVKKAFLVDAAARGDGFSDQARKTRREENRISAATGATVSTRALAQEIQKSALSFFQNVRRREQ